MKNRTAFSNIIFNKMDNASFDDCSDRLAGSSAAVQVPGVRWSEWGDPDWVLNYSLNINLQARINLCTRIHLYSPTPPQ